MKLALFDDYRLGVVDGDQIADVTDVLEEHDAEWPWVFVPRTIMHFDRIRPRIEAALPHARRTPLAQVRLRPPIPAPSKIAAAASNYRAHNAEMAKYFAEGRFGAPQQQASTGGMTTALPDVPGRPPGERGEVFLKSALVHHWPERHHPFARYDPGQRGPSRARARRRYRPGMPACLSRSSARLRLRLYGPARYHRAG